MKITNEKNCNFNTDLIISLILWSNKISRIVCSFSSISSLLLLLLFKWKFEISALVNACNSFVSALIWSLWLFGSSLLALKEKMGSLFCISSLSLTLFLFRWICDILDGLSFEILIMALIWLVSKCKSKRSYEMF